MKKFAYLLVVVILLSAILCSCKQGDINLENSFYGGWKIEKLIPTNSVSMYSDEDIKKIIGSQISYKEEYASSYDGNCNKPYYQVTKVSQGDFESNSRVSFKSLDIIGDSVFEVKVFANKDLNNLWNSNACLFWIKDKDTLILYDGGDYLELVRKS